jgi:hypothetical protein
VVLCASSHLLRVAEQVLDQLRPKVRRARLGVRPKSAPSFSPSEVGRGWPASFSKERVEARGQSIAPSRK